MFAVRGTIGIDPDRPRTADLRRPFVNSLARSKKLQWDFFPAIRLPTQHARTKPRAESGGDQHANQVPTSEKRRCQLRAMQGIYERTDGSRREPARSARPAQPRRGKAPHDPKERY